jgi:hypothetical protein
VLSVALCATLLAACGGSGGSGSPAPPTPQPPIVERSFDFSLGNGGWLSGQADYTMDTAPTDVVNDLRSLPAPFAGLGFYSAGTNRSDDLLIYVKTRLSGLVASTTYRVSATVEFLTDVPSGCLGVGGAPGESVWIITAVSTGEPLTIFTGGNYRLNLERGNQSVSGRDGIVLGTLANSVPNCGERRWESKTVSTPSPSPLSVRADERGEAWFLIGFDSGFESFSRLYYRRVTVRLEPT